MTTAPLPIPGLAPQARRDPLASERRARMHRLIEAQFARARCTLLARAWGYASLAAGLGAFSLAGGNPTQVLAFPVALSCVFSGSMAASLGILAWSAAARVRAAGAAPTAGRPWWHEIEGALLATAIAAAGLLSVNLLLPQVLRSEWVSWFRNVWVACAVSLVGLLIFVARPDPA